MGRPKVRYGSNSANHPDFQLVRFVSDRGPLLQRRVRRIMLAAVVHNFLPKGANRMQGSRY